MLPPMEETPRQRAAREALSKRNKELGVVPGVSPHQLYLDVARFDAFCLEHGHRTHEAIAAWLGLGIATVSNARRGRRISDAFVSALHQKVEFRRDLRFQDFFSREKPADLVAA